MTQTIWTQIYETLSKEIALGHYPKGQKLPTEAKMAKRFQVNRHTIRRALSVLQDDGAIHIRQGAGAFVNQTPLDYRLGSKTRFSQNLEQTGLSLDRKILRLETVPAAQKEAEVLALAKGALVHVLEAASIVDGAPFSYSKSMFPAERFPDLKDTLQTVTSITEAFRLNGVDDYSRKWTKLTAKRAHGTIARALHIAEGAPVLRSVSLNIDPVGQAIEYGRTWFHADRAQLVVEG